MCSSVDRIKPDSVVIRLQSKCYGAGTPLFATNNLKTRNRLEQSLLVYKATSKRKAVACYVVTLIGRIWIHQDRGKNLQHKQARGFSLSSQDISNFLPQTQWQWVRSHGNRCTATATGAQPRQTGCIVIATNADSSQTVITQCEQSQLAFPNSLKQSTLNPKWHKRDWENRCTQQATPSGDSCHHSHLVFFTFL